MDHNTYKAAVEGDLDTLWQNKDNLHQRFTPTKNTVLHIYIACATPVESEEEVHKSTNIVDKIIEICPPLLFQPNDSGDTALHIAARHGIADIVKALLLQAANSHDPHDHDGDLEKGFPIKQDRARMHLLIRTANKEKETALQEAARFNQRFVVRLLTERDPEFLYSANIAGDTPLYLAAERGYRDLVFLMLETCKYPAYGGHNGRMALHAAVICNDEEMIGELLKYTKMAPMKEADGRGWTPLHLAAHFGHTPIAKQLLESDRSAAYVGDKDYKKTPLHIAAYEGHETVMEELISYSPGCGELVDHKGQNVLHYAIKCHHAPVADFVLNHPWLSNVLLNRKDADGNTPLHLLALSPHYAAAERFIGDARVDKMVAFNKENLNALDIILADDTLLPELKNTVEGILDRNGAKPGCHRVTHEDSGRKFSPFRKTEIEQEGKHKGGKDTDVLKEVKQAHLVVATLIATVTFAAGFTMPGGYQSDKGPEQGFAVLTRSVAFNAFVLADTLAMAMSAFSVCMHFYLSIFRRQEEIVWALSCTMTALILMVIAFLTGTYAVLGHSLSLAITSCVLGCFYFSGAFIYLSPTTRILRKLLAPLILNRI